MGYLSFVVFSARKPTIESVPSPVAIAEHTLELGVPGALPTLSPLWTRKLRGAISSLSVSKNGAAILIATFPDSEIEGSSNTSELTRFDRRGRVMWRHQMKNSVRDQDISDDDSLTVTGYYGAELIGMNARGKTLWTAEGMCRPRILNLSKKILCYHDDDAEPRIAFDVFDWKGKKLLSYPITTDILALKISDDERNVVFALTGGEVVLLNSDFQTLWKKNVEGEIIDVSVTSVPEAKVAVLFKSKEGQQRIAVMNGEGSPLESVVPSFRSTQVEFAPTGSAVYYYGNNPEGQFVGSSSLPLKAESWRRGGSYGADYSSSIVTTSQRIFMGLEEIEPSGRSSHLLGFDPTGKLELDLKLPEDDGAYIYTHKFSSASSLLVVGTDDGNSPLTKFLEV